MNPQPCRYVHNGSISNVFSAAGIHTDCCQYEAPSSYVMVCLQYMGGEDPSATVDVRGGQSAMWAHETKRIMDLYVPPDQCTSRHSVCNEAAVHQLASFVADQRV